MVVVVVVVVVFNVDLLFVNDLFWPWAGAADKWQSPSLVHIVRENTKWQC